MEKRIIFIIIIFCCCCIILSGSGYYYTQSTSSKPKPVESNKPVSTSNKPVSTSNTPVSTSNPSVSISNPTVSTKPKIIEKIVIGQDNYAITDADGIKTGVYKNIPNATFLLINNLNRWTITIILKSDNYKQSFQGIIGNMYNKEITNGWGIWINPNGKLHFRVEDKTWDLNDLGLLVNNHEYQIIINFSRTGYSFRLTNLKYLDKSGKLLKKFEINTSGAKDGNIEVNNNDPDFEFRSAVLSVQEYKKADPNANFNANFDTDSNVDNLSYSISNFNKKIITDKGFITIGGWWENRDNEKFKGDINYLEFHKM